MSPTTNNSSNINKQRVVKRQLFPQKLWDLVNRPSSGIQWSPDGKRIQVERSQLEKFIGTKFRSHNFDSFIRQLHFYGFRKCGNSYHHDKFQRGQPNALLTMKRKYSNLNSLCNLDSQSNSSGTSINSNTHANINNNNMIIDNNDNNNNDSSDTIDCIEQAIDYSKKSLSKCLPEHDNRITLLKTTSNSSICNQTQMMSKSLTTIANTITTTTSNQDSIPAVTGKKLNNNSKEITMYTLKSVDSETSSTISSFTNIRKNLAKADSENTSIKITLPEIMNDNSKGAWPKTLVLDSYWNGKQNILSAYFLYKTE